MPKDQEKTSTEPSLFDLADYVNEPSALASTWPPRPPNPGVLAVAGVPLEGESGETATAPSEREAHAMATAPTEGEAHEIDAHGAEAAAPLKGGARGPRTAPARAGVRGGGGDGRGGGGDGRGRGDGASGGGDEAVALHEAAQSRYLNYALSVITSRALPDVRDGLKPVQRRILFTMWQQNLTASAKHRKCAKVVGDVMGSYHPHGDAALYETLVRMAQPFSLRYPLVDGSGNFGSLDGDAAAAMRYTECRLARISDRLLDEIDSDTVPFRPNYDGTKTEPVVLPARLPNLLVNGATGIAVGMATSIPPHNLGEICTALIKLSENPDLSTAQLCRWVKGPDFPTGGQILNTPEELKEIYKTGSGAIRARGTWETGSPTRSGQTVFITSVPYTVNKAVLVERIAEIVLSRKLPPLVDVKDISTDDVRIELTIKREADPKMVMAYLFKHTP
ncbi:MAG TPA: DNA gyrase subunit A, partial [Vicinamibacterales bacterium]|nr:DNA gyrase subunit A [Vicinamibacterales bacterium]